MLNGYRRARGTPCGRAASIRCRCTATSRAGSGRCRCLEIVNPPIWELAHIAYFQEFFCRRWRPDDPAGGRTGSRLAGADALFDSRTVAHDTRWSLAYPPIEGVFRYLEETLAATLADLASSRDDDRHRFRLALYHEDMHGEALLMTLHTLGLPAPRREHHPSPAPVEGAVRDIPFPGGEFLQGTARDAGEHAFDNEKWAHPVRVAPFAIASRPVTQRAIRRVRGGGRIRTEGIVDAGGVAMAPGGGGGRAAQLGARRGRLVDAVVRFAPPTARGRACRPGEPPRSARRGADGRGDGFPRKANGSSPRRTAAARIATPGAARCRRVALGLDYRLERPALAPDPAPAASGVEMMIGGVWEWTSSRLSRPIPASRPDPYREYSEPWFHSHDVLRGGMLRDPLAARAQPLPELLPSRSRRRVRGISHLRGRRAESMCDNSFRRASPH